MTTQRNERRPRPSSTRRGALLGLAGTALLASCRTAPRAQPSPHLDDELLALIRSGDAAAVTRMLDEEPALVRAADRQGRSAFVVAHLSGHPEIGALLLARGLELDVVEAVLAADWERVEALAAREPELMQRAHPIGGTPLYASALVGGSEQYRLRALGCDPDARPTGGSGLSPARAAMDCRDPIGAWLAATDILSNGGDPNAPQARGDSVLHGAVRARDARLVKLVLRKGGSTEARDERERTALSLAKELEWTEGVELLEHEDRIPRDHRASRLAFNHSREPFRLVPIDDVPVDLRRQITGRSHFDPTVRALLEQEPRLIHAVSTDAELAIEACGHTGQREVIQIHLDHGAPLSLPTAISLGDLDHARWLLKNDPQLVNERGPHDFAVTWYPAIGGGSVEAAELLLEYGADLEQHSGGETALHHAAMRGHVDLVRFLLERDADVHALGYRQDRAGRTPLQAALANEQRDVARLLRDFGARR